MSQIGARPAGSSNTGNFMAIFNGTNGNDTLTGSTSGDQINGGDGNDRLDGAAGNDTLNGGAGLDVLIGGLGADLMTGGTGNDTYYVDNPGDVVVETGADTLDKIVSSIGITALAAGVERLELTGSAHLQGTGNELANVLRGNDGNNRLDGLGGGDRMWGGLGDDTYVVNSELDMVDEFAGEGKDTIESTVSYSLDEVTGQGVEILRLMGTASINATGSGDDNLLVGNDGNNILDGGGGNDRMSGGLGNDTYIVDSTGDLVLEFGDAVNSAKDLVKASISFSLADDIGKLEVERLTLTGTDAIDATGNDLDNTLIGNAADNVLDGGAGADAMSGGQGSDTYLVDSIDDVVYEFDETAAGGEFDVIVSQIGFGLDAFGASGVEALLLRGPGALSATGNDLGNLIMGNDEANAIDGGLGGDDLYGAGGNDVLRGGEGDDALMGEAGGDVLEGGAGGDQLAGGTGNDALDGGSGDDIYYFAAGFGTDTLADQNLGVNADEVHFQAASYNRLWFQRAGNDLRILEVGTANTVTVRQWFTGVDHQVESIVADTSGMVLTAGKVSGLVSAMASFAPQDLSSTTAPASLVAARNAAWTAA